MRNFGIWWVMMVGALPAAACAVGPGEPGGEDIDQAAQAIGIECASAFPTVTFVGGANYVSPQTYDTPSCSKAVVVDINTYSSTFLGPGDVPGGTYIRWADAGVSTQAACTSSWVIADLFQLVNGAWVFRASWGSAGVWVPAGDLFEAFCEMPGVSFTGNELIAGQTYRIAATARTALSNSAPTRKVSVISVAPIVIR